MSIVAAAVIGGVVGNLAGAWRTHRWVKRESARIAAWVEAERRAIREGK